MKIQMFLTALKGSHMKNYTYVSTFLLAVVIGNSIQSQEAPMPTTQPLTGTYLAELPERSLLPAILRYVIEAPTVDQAITNILPFENTFRNDSRAVSAIKAAFKNKGFPQDSLRALFSLYLNEVSKMAARSENYQSPFEKIKFLITYAGLDLNPDEPYQNPSDKNYAAGRGYLGNEKSPLLAVLYEGWMAKKYIQDASIEGITAAVRTLTSFLIAQGTDVSRVGERALARAISFGDIGLLDMLIRAGANIAILRPSMTPADIKPEVLDYLKSQGWLPPQEEPIPPLEPVEG